MGWLYKAFDRLTNSILVRVRNALQDNDTQIIHLIEETSKAAGTYRVEFFSSNFNYRTIQFKCSSDVTMTLHITNNPDADTSSDDSWTDVTSEVFNLATISNKDITQALDTPARPLKWMVKYVVTSSANVDAWIRQYS